MIDSEFEAAAMTAAAQAATGRAGKLRSFLVLSESLDPPDLSAGAGEWLSFEERKDALIRFQRQMQKERMRATMGPTVKPPDASVRDERAAVPAAAEVQGDSAQSQPQLSAGSATAATAVALQCDTAPAPAYPEEQAKKRQAQSEALGGTATTAGGMPLRDARPQAESGTQGQGQPTALRVPLTPPRRRPPARR